MYGNVVEYGHMAVWMHENWWIIFAVIGLANLVKFLWSAQGKKNEKTTSRAQALALVLVAVKRKVEEHYEPSSKEAFAVFEEERALLSDESRYPDAWSIAEEYKSWSRHQDAMAKKRAMKEREEFRADSEKKSNKEFRPQFHQKRDRKHQNRLQRSEKTAEIWLPGGQIKRV